jgi:hypothetical protein
MCVSPNFSIYPCLFSQGSLASLLSGESQHRVKAIEQGRFQKYPSAEMIRSVERLRCVERRENYHERKKEINYSINGLGYKRLKRDFFNQRSFAAHVWFRPFCRFYTHILASRVSVSCSSQWLHLCKGNQMPEGSFFSFLSFFSKFKLINN